jgi:hypothetical protein
LFPEGKWIQVLKIDGDLGLDGIDGTAISFSGTGSATPVGQSPRYFTTRRCGHAAALIDA